MSKERFLELVDEVHARMAGRVSRLKSENAPQAGESIENALMDLAVFHTLAEIVNEKLQGSRGLDAPNKNRRPGQRRRKKVPIETSESQLSTEEPIHQTAQS